MLSVIGAASRRALIEAIVPRSIARSRPMACPPGHRGAGAGRAEGHRAKNQVLKSFIGQGYHGTHTPGVILRNILENPAWYTAYTPYQAEISQGRMEALVNFQTMVCDLTGMAIANASMLDEATAAAEAMTLAKRSVKSKSDTHRRGRRLPSADDRGDPAPAPRRWASRWLVGFEWDSLMDGGDYFAVLAQYPTTDGSIHDLKPDVDARARKQAAFIVAADLLALTLLVPPGEFGADIVVGNTQRFGVPMGGGGPHAAYLACRDEFKRSMPGRLVGVSIDAHGQPAYRLALQTREQHIRREKATVQHLHRAGAAGGDRQHVCRLPRARGPEAHRAARGQLHRHPRRGPAQLGCAWHAAGLRHPAWTPASAPTSHR
jgi:glycine dehydrogenase